MKIRFETVADVIKFTQFTEKLEHSNIDVHRGNQYLDGKSFLGMTNVCFYEDYEVSIITSDSEEQKRFDEYIKHWKGGKS